MMGGQRRQWLDNITVDRERAWVDIVRLAGYRNVVSTFRIRRRQRSLTGHGKLIWCKRAMRLSAGSVREYVFYVFFQISKKHDFLRFFDRSFKKRKKSL